MKKITILLIFIILASSLVISTSLKECQRTMFSRDIPCIVATSYLPSTTCQDYNATIINQQNETLENLTFYSTISSCQFIFTHDSVNIYFWNSSIESGVITVEKENNMIAIILVFILLISYFAILGWLNASNQLKFLCFSLSIIELIMMVAIIYISEGAGDYMPILSVNFYAILIVGFGVGMLTFFFKSADMANLASDESVNPMEQNKWNHKKW